MGLGLTVKVLGWPRLRDCDRLGPTAPLLGLLEVAAAAAACSKCLVDNCLIISRDLLLDWPIPCGGWLDPRPGEDFPVTPPPPAVSLDLDDLNDSALETLLFEAARRCWCWCLAGDFLLLVEVDDEELEEGGAAVSDARKLPFSFVSSVLSALSQPLNGRREGLSNVLLLIESVDRSVFGIRAPVSPETDPGVPGVAGNLLSVLLR